MAISKKIVLLIPSIMGLAIGLVVLLAWIALKPITQSAKFNRSFISATLTEESKMPNDGIIGLSGVTPTHFFFQTKDPSILIITDHDLKNKDSLKLKLPNYGRMTSGVYTYVDSPYVTILAGRLSLALETDLNSNDYLAYKFPTTLFTRIIRIAPNSFVVRGVDTSVKKSDQLFIKVNSRNNIITRENDISETNKDAGISTDGMLSYDSENAVLIYTYFYENKFICIDTNMNLRYTGHTIDNTKSLPIRSEVNKNVLTANTPKRNVNDFSTTYKGYLFNTSVIKGENETNETYKRNSSIDIYDIKSGRYKGTFYIPHYKNERMRRFAVLENRIVAFYTSSIISHKFSLEIIKK